ncbi:MAG: hydrogenase maturation nickel metallochaperone HypA [Endomicrobiia bacterium]|nr:hydrogenase maturation nickel metallochaperone HypA [Endomicrobiia bacterium]
MHELTLARPLFADMKAAAGKGLKNITRVVIAVGAASGVDPDFLRHSLKDHLFEGTSFASAALEIIVSEPLIKCRRCSKSLSGKDISADMPLNKCPSCGSAALDVVSGDEVRLVAVI